MLRFAPRLIAYALLACAQAHAQVGPIEPIIVSNSKPGQALANIPDTKQDYLVPFEATVSADGAVTDVTLTTPTGDEKVDASIVRFVSEKIFLPALDAAAQPVEARVQGTVDFKSKSINKQLKINMKPPNTQNEVARVRKLTCKDFTWEIGRLRQQGGSTDLAREIMPWVSLRVYLVDRKIPLENESTIMPKWPAALATAETDCKTAPEKNYLKDVLTPLLDTATG